MERFQLRLDEFKELFFKIYNDRCDATKEFEEVLNIIQNAYDTRSLDLKSLDNQRYNNFQWFMSNNMVGMMLYVDLFSDNLTGFIDKIPYLKDLGITYIHFMPILKMPKDNNDGGYAVSSYEEIDSKFGNMEQFKNITKLLRENGISTCLDFVINHTSSEHSWAMEAKEGNKKYQEMYFMFDTDELPKKYEENMIEVFPKVAPGNFTWDNECKKYVMTNFYPYQWDLNFKNPDVFKEILRSILLLANAGVEILRLDAIPYIWKELGTSCRGLEEVHTIVRMYKLVVESVTPAMIFKGEAIVAPSEILSYFGGLECKECNTMYNASLMTLIWNSLATRNTSLMRLSLETSPVIPDNGTWINYARCHDDIGWGFNENLIYQINEDPFLHKQFLINFFEGKFPGSFALGELYEFDEKTMDARTSGTLASLCGLEKAINEKDEYQQYLAVKRIVLLHNIILSYNGIPVIYSGDEIGQLNDYNYKNVPTKSHDSRWLHRPKMEWDKSKLHKTQIEIFEQLKRLISIRKEQEIFSANILPAIFDTGNKGVFGMYKSHNRENLLMLSNFTEHVQTVDITSFKNSPEGMVDIVQGKVISNFSSIMLAPYEFLWLM